MFNPIAPYPSRAIVPYAFGDQVIKWRIPHHMYGELVVEPGAHGENFSEGLFRMAIDKPFEVWRMKAIVTAYSGGPDFEDAAMLEPQPTTMAKRIRLAIKDLTKNQDLSKTPTPVEHYLNDDRLSWEWEIPYTIVNSEGFEVTVDADVFPAYCINDAEGDCTLTSVTTTFARVEVSFQGYLLFLQAADDR